jgi:SNF2 family DNA or RNA helicase
LLYHPSLYNNATRRGEIHTVLLIVPVNTLANWENEVEKWTGEFSSTIPVYNLSQTSHGGVRQSVINKWSKKGGILLTSDRIFQGLIKKHCCLEQLQSPGPDVIVLDEAHTMLKNRDNLVFKALMGVQTLRRICLTGSPFQNNLLEYFRMVSYIRPGLLGTSERKFEKDYVQPILEGNVADASDAVKQDANRLLFKIQEQLRPYMHRKDASVLLQDLPGMQQVVLHVRRTKVQSRLYGAFSKYRKNHVGLGWNNFLRIYGALRPLHNHPACLLLSKSAKSEEMMAVKASRKSSFTAESATEIQERQASRRPSVSQDDDVRPTQAVKQEATALTTKNPAKDDGTTKSESDIIDLMSDSEPEEEDLEAEVQDTAETGQWWKNVARRCGDGKLADVTNGNKVVLLLHILVHATMLDEKVVVFSQCLNVRKLGVLCCFLGWYYFVGSKLFFRLLTLFQKC